MTSELINKDDLREPYIVTKDLAIKNITDFNSYKKTMTTYAEKLVKLELNNDFQNLLEFGNAISSDVRLKILHFIYLSKTTCFCELESIFKIKKSTLNYHIKILVRIGLVQTYKKGKVIIIELGSMFHELIPEKFRVLFSELSAL